MGTLGATDFGGAGSSNAIAVPLTGQKMKYPHDARGPDGLGLARLTLSVSASLIKREVSL